MLKQRIFDTIRFFGLQDFPVTLLEMEKYLVEDLEKMKAGLDGQWELKESGENRSLDSTSTHPAIYPQDGIHSGSLGMDRADENIRAHEILKCLDEECKEEVESLYGFYFLKGRKEIVEKRLANYEYGIQREKRIKRYAYDLRFLPFVRGVGLSGSQALGQQKETSDIDLFIVTDPDFLWLARTLVTAYFQLFGVRRHGKYIPNRFCLNHYVASPKELSEHRNIYTASEYLKLRPLSGEAWVKRFVYNNKPWISQFFPNAEFSKPELEEQPAFQKVCEYLLTGSFGRWLEQKLKNWQLPKIRVEEKYIVVKENELSFHPESKQENLLKRFYQAR